MDACHSGAGKAAETMSQSFAKTIFPERIDESKGMVTLASCDIDEASYEMDDSKHGAFTYFLIEALKGKADRDKDGELWASEANYYVWDNTRKWAAQLGLKQTPKYVSVIQGEITLAKVDTAPPQLEIRQPEEWRKPGAILKLPATSKTIHISGLATDNSGISNITVNDQGVSLTIPAPRDMQLVPIKEKATKFETEIPISNSGAPIQNIIIRAYDVADNVTEISYELQFPPPEPPPDKPSVLPPSPRHIPRGQVFAASLLIPGLGQHFQGRHLRGLSYETLTIASGVTALWARNRHQNAQKEYLKDRDQLAKTAQNQTELTPEVRDLKAKQDRTYEHSKSARRLAIATQIAFGFVWGINALDAGIVNPPPQKRLTFEVQPVFDSIDSIDSIGGQLLVSLRF